MKRFDETFPGIPIQPLVQSCLICCLALSALEATARGVEPQPDGIRFGTLRTNARAEASVRIYWELVVGNNTKAVAECPDFVVIENVASDITTTYKGQRSSDYTDLVISADTGNPGSHEGEIRVTYGRHQAVIPVSVNVRDRTPAMRRILVVETPFQKFSTNDSTMFDAWLKLVDKADVDVSYLVVPQGGPVLADVELESFDVVLLGGSGLFFVNDDEINRLQEFVSHGGRLIISANAFMVGTVEKANALLQPLAMTMFDTESPTTRGVELSGNAILRHPLTREVERLSFFRPSPVAALDRQTSAILAFNTGGNGDGLIGRAAFGHGEVVVLGVSLWWKWVDVDSEQFDNAQLMQNLLTAPISPH